MPDQSLWVLMWRDVAAAVGPVGAFLVVLGLVLSAVGFGMAWLFWRRATEIQTAKDKQAEWIQQYLVRVIERQTVSNTLIAAQVEEVSRSLPSPPSAG